MNDEFKVAVYSAIGSVPEGFTASYGYIARLAGQPKHARAVGYLLKHLPKDSSLPWFRIVNSKREISFPFGTSSYQRQLEALQAEGISLDNGKIKKEFFVG
ncbi:MGMT family protein [Pseudoalteromonas xiamenensis]|uniref:MGMT family protein n=1 Tax=Pseudoalteromonas xiamenensis TaxID=882626 RepID=A0A975HML4_9GAMM|nr:MGMT family protein [Pseudoalteromonas xiamenensis]